MWVLNPIAYKQVVPFGTAAGILSLVLGAALAVAGAGWFQRRLWGWRLAVAIIAAQVLGDLVNAVRGDVVKGGYRLHNCRCAALPSSAPSTQSCVFKCQCAERSWMNSRNLKVQRS
jgi:hypothetical protein